MEALLKQGYALNQSLKEAIQLMKEMLSMPADPGLATPKQLSIILPISIIEDMNMETAKLKGFYGEVLSGLIAFM